MMSFGTALYTFLLKPLQLIFEIIYNIAYQYIGDPGLAIIALSLAINFLVLPLYRRADAMQEEERETEAKLSKWVTHIKKTFRGDERTMMLQTYYRQNHYSPVYVLRSAVSLLLEIPFFIAAYRFLSGLSLLEKVSFGPISDLSKPDQLLQLGTLSLNVLPFVMTGLNLLSAAIFTKGSTLRQKIQLYAMAVFFLVFLYDSPSGLVFYWTLNNLFSLVKTIFYKLKKPKLVLSILAALFSLPLFPFAWRLFFSRARRAAVFTVLVALVLWLPLALCIYRARGGKGFTLPEREPDPKLFLLGGLFLSVLTGLMIPSAVIKASPQEFMDLVYFVHPLWYLAYAFLTAAGFFVFWLGVFYRLADRRTKHLFESIIWILSGVGVMDYLFFGTGLGLLSPNLAYEKGILFNAKQIVINGLAVLLLAAVLLLLFIKRRSLIRRLLPVGIMAVICMAGINAGSIRSSVAAVDVNGSRESPSFTLSRKGKNVVVIMLDRAMGEYVPYLLNEKPELKELFSGFTYYSNVISFGGHTNFASAALYGGYEYTPVEMNRRKDESLASKQNEALKVMPVLFDSKNYDVTVMDPTYAGYQWIPDLSIYDEYPGIKRYNTMGFFSDPEDIRQQVEGRNRNFFLFGLMKTLPLLAQGTIYNRGYYNDFRGPQVVLNAHVAYGTAGEFMKSYTVLERLSDMTVIRDDGVGAFMMMSNDTTHDQALLEEPSYTPADFINNTAYDEANKDRFTVNGVTLKVDTIAQMSHYQMNMAAFLKLGEWFEYLKENDLYDNTRIILVSDHGYGLNQLEAFDYKGGVEGEYSQLEYYFPLLMVKDFGATDFTVSDAFMTNADVPVLATRDLIEDPVNPMTGKALNNAEKTAHDQYIIVASRWRLEENSGNMFEAASWHSVHDSIWDQKNWTPIAENAILPWDLDTVQ